VEDIVMTENGAAESRAVIEEYVEACRVGDVARLRAIFHPQALMSGYYLGEFYAGTPEPFYDEVGDNPSPKKTGAVYTGTITSAEQTGDCASLTLKEIGFLGSNFTDWFHLARVGGVWLILSKTYVDQ
jgi:hypothetical protein